MNSFFKQYPAKGYALWDENKANNAKEPLVLLAVEEKIDLDIKLLANLSINRPLFVVADKCRPSELLDIENITWTSEILCKRALSRLLISTAETTLCKIMQPAVDETKDDVIIRQLAEIIESSVPWSSRLVDSFAWLEIAYAKAWQPNFETSINLKCLSCMDMVTHQRSWKAFDAFYDSSVRAIEKELSLGKKHARAKNIGRTWAICLGAALSDVQELHKNLDSHHGVTTSCFETMPAKSCAIGRIISINSNCDEIGRAASSSEEKQLIKLFKDQAEAAINFLNNQADWIGNIYSLNIQ